MWSIVSLVSAVQDEVDSLGGQRGGGQEDPAARRLLTELLIQMTQVAEQSGVFVFACTNRIQVGWQELTSISVLPDDGVAVIAWRNTNAN